MNNRTRMLIGNIEPTPWMRENFDMTTGQSRAGTFFRPVILTDMIAKFPDITESDMSEIDAWEVLCVKCSDSLGAHYGITCRRDEP